MKPTKNPKHPNLVSIYLTDEETEQLLRMSELCGVSRGCILTQIIRNALPKTKLKVSYELLIYES